MLVGKILIAASEAGHRLGLILQSLPGCSGHPHSGRSFFSFLLPLFGSRVGALELSICPF